MVLTSLANSHITQALGFLVLRHMKQTTVEGSSFRRICNFMSTYWSNMPSTQMRWMVHKMLRRGIKLGLLYQKHGFYKLTA